MKKAWYSEHLILNIIAGNLLIFVYAILVAFLIEILIV
jgi:hypothetical protein